MDYSTSAQRANQRYDMAFHMLKVSYPLLKDHKLLMGILLNLLQSTEYAVDAILEYERQLKLVSAYPQNFNGKVDFFRSKSLKRNNISPNIIATMMKMKELVELQKESPIEFSRGNRYVLSKKDYQLHSISIVELEDFANQTKELLSNMQQIISHFDKNE